ncbi:MAG: hypothetical protein SH818_11965 [Saprospiraceae bacterium]|nr:hypothetical protein [Saprospiraceae bacterium]
MSIKIYLGLIGILFTAMTWGQTQQQPPTAKYYVSGDSTLYWNKSLPVYIKLATTPDGAGVNLTSKEFAQYTNPIYLDTEGPNYIRTRYAVDKDSREIKSPKTEVLLEVVADGQPPATSISFKNANTYTVDSKHYYGPGLQFDLFSEDKYAGVEGILVAIDNENYSPYRSTQSILKEGPLTIRYQAVDRVGNLEPVKSTAIISDLSPPSITHNINGISDSNTIASSSTIYFTATDNLSGVSKSYYRFDDQSFIVYPGSNLNLSHLDDGPHVLEYYSVDFVGNRSTNTTFSFYYDKLAPLTASDILGDKYLYQEKVYFSGRTKMKLTAIDNKAGVKEIYYAVDNDQFKIYEDPFYLPSLQGNHTIKFYSVDRLSNRPSGAEEYKHNINLVFLDLTGPDISHNFSGPTFKTADELFLGPLTSINLVAKDNQSGLQYISYSIDGVQAETRYDKPIVLNVSSGKHKIEMFAYDNVNNRNIHQTEIHFDSGAPQILPNFSTKIMEQKEGLPVYPAYTVLFLAATDEIVGNDKIFYSINEGAEQTYSNPISNFQTGKKYDIKVRAVDKVGNESRQTVSFFTLNK